MATLNSQLLSLVDVTKRLDPDGSVATDIAELLTQENQILLDIPWKESNTLTGHVITMRTGLPTGIWRKFNQGVPNSKSTTVQVTETMGMYEQKGAVDKDLAMLNGNTAEFRMSENQPHIDSINIDMTTALFYADANTPERPVGLAPRYSSTAAGNGQNILLCGGASTDNTSVWLLGWGNNSLFGIYPKGSKAGLQHIEVKDGSEDGCMEVDDGTGTGSTFRAYVDRYQWKAGWALKDWRYAVRAANIKVADLLAPSGTQAITAATNIIKIMSRMIDRIPSQASVKLAFYCNRTVFSGLKLAALDKSNAALSISDAIMQFGFNAGKTVKELQFLGIPIRICDALVNNEAVVS